MNDNILSWALSGLGGILEILEKQVEGREKIQSDKVQRLAQMAKKVVDIAKVATGKSE